MPYRSTNIKQQSPSPRLQGELSIALRRDLPVLVLLALLLLCSLVHAHVTYALPLEASASGSTAHLYCSGGHAVLNRTLSYYSLLVLADNTTLLPSSKIPCNSSLTASSITIAHRGSVLVSVTLDENGGSVLVGSSTLIVTSSSTNITVASRPCSGYQSGKHYFEIACTATRPPESLLMLIVRDSGEVLRRAYTGSLLELAWRSGAISMPPARCNTFPPELPSSRDLVIVVVNWGSWQDLVVATPSVPEERGPEGLVGASTSTIAQEASVNGSVVLLPPPSNNT